MKSIKNTTVASIVSMIMKRIIKTSYIPVVVVHINAQNVVALFDEIHSIFSNLNLHILAISESWLKPPLSSPLVELDGYILLRNNRLDKRGGGVAMYNR